MTNSDYYSLHTYSFMSCCSYVVLLVCIYVVIFCPYSYVISYIVITVYSLYAKCFTKCTINIETCTLNNCMRTTHTQHWWEYSTIIGVFDELHVPPHVWCACILKKYYRLIEFNSKILVFCIRSDSILYSFHK